MWCAKAFAAPYGPMNGGKPPLVVVPARLLRDKGLREFVDAARTLRAQGVAARFALVGAHVKVECTACHGPSMAGRAPAIPGLLGLPRDYLIAQFGQWVNGKRKAAAPDCMGEIAGKLTADDISAVATWLAAQPVVESALKEAGVV